MKMPLIPHLGDLFGEEVPVPSYRFMVFFNEFCVAFQGVSGIGKTMDVRYFNEGGVNKYPIMVRGPQSSPHKLIFKRGMVVRRLTSSLLSFVPDIASSLLDVESAIDNPGSLGLIIVLDRDKELKAIYSFISQGKVDWQLSDLNSKGNEFVIETFTISHRGLYNIPVPNF